MQEIVYTEFGVTSRITKYKVIGSELKGMRAGKPFTMNGEIYINHDGKLNHVEEIRFADKSGSELTRAQVKLDTDTRIGIVLICNDEVLLMKRIKPEREYYGFPGGHMREGESQTDALIRETEEELGLTVSKMKYYLIASTNGKGFGPERFYRIEYLNKPEITPEDPTDETTKFIWMRISEAQRLNNL